jgi:hypothetical protein
MTFEDPRSVIYATTFGDFTPPSTPVPLVVSDKSVLPAHEAIPSPHGPIVAYQTIADAAEYGGAPRVFIERPAFERRRAVRR